MLVIQREWQGKELCESKTYAYHNYMHFQITVQSWSTHGSYQSKSDEEELKDVSVSDRDEPTEECVEDGNNGTDDDAGNCFDVQDNLQGWSQRSQNWGRPEYFRSGRGNGLQGTPLPIFLGERVNHGDVPGLSHLASEERST